MNPNICMNCGGTYEYRNGRWICRFCGAYRPEQISNEEVTLLYYATQKLRLYEFEDAENAYTDIIQEYPENPNAYWGRLMSRYGIKYEEDFDGKRIPTCYATSIESIVSDRDFLRACSLADADTKEYYKMQAEYIERVRKEWLEKARKEKPYDIFICYKDSDLANGIERTADSIAAQDLYIHLKEQGYRVFFSRESLRDKVGEKYEPYIFNALSTAKVMIVYGTSPDYITSTWLKNEWTRYEKRIHAGEKQSNSLIVACDGFSPNELPTILSSKQCLDANRKTFFIDLDNCIKRILQEPLQKKQTPAHREQPRLSGLHKHKNKTDLPFQFKNIFDNWINHKKSLFSSETSLQEKTIIIWGLLAWLGFVISGIFSLITDSGDKTPEYDIIISVGAIMVLCIVPYIILNILKKVRTANTDKSSSLPFCRTSLNIVSNLSLAFFIVFLVSGICDIQADGMTMIIISVVFLISSIICSIYAYFPTNYTYLQLSNGSKPLKRKKIAIIGITICVIIFIVAGALSSPIKSVGVRTITFSDKFTAEYVLAKWENGSKSEASMIEIMDEYGAQQGGGELHIVRPDEFVEEIDEWLFSPVRKAGDYIIIENAYGYSLCYISSINPKVNETD